MAIGREINNFVKTFLATYKIGKDTDYRDRYLKLKEDQAKGMSAEDMEKFLSAFGVGGRRGGSSEGSGDVTSDPQLASLEPHQKAFLNAIAGPESAGAYNVRYGGADGAKTFDGFDTHPSIAERITSGPNAGRTSDAAGRYQFLSSTWNSLPSEAKGDGKFTPENQDRAAWFLAQRDYKARTGRDLDADLRERGLTPNMLGALSGTWEGFRTNPSRALNAYTSSLGRYTRRSEEGYRPGAVQSSALPPLPPRRPADAAPAEEATQPAPAPPPPPAALPSMTTQPLPRLSSAEEEPSDQPMQTAALENEQPAALPMEEDTQFAAQGGMIEPQHDQAVAAALMDVQNSLGQEDAALPGTDPQQGQRMEAFQRGEGAISPDAYDALRQAVDPEGMNPNATRDAMDKIYRFYASKGDKAAAAKASSGVLQAARNRSMEFGKMAGDALQQKNYQLAARALASAYNEVPDGKRVTAEVNEQGVGKATVMDAATDKVVEEMPLTPRALGAAAMQFMGGNQFYVHLARSMPRSSQKATANG